MRAAALRQRAQHPQRDRPRAAAPGRPAVRRGDEPLARDDLMTIEAQDILRQLASSEAVDDAPPDHPRRRRRLGGRQDHDHPRARARARRGRTSPTSCTDDYHRYDRKQRAEHGITPLHPDCNYLDIMAQHLAPPARRRRRSSSPSTGTQDGTFGAAGVRRRRASFTVVEGLLGYHTQALRDVYDVRVFLAPPEELRRRWKVAARLLAARLHDRPGARRARPPRARLRGVHPPAAALRRHGRVVQRRATATTRRTSTPS